MRSFKPMPSSRWGIGRFYLSESKCTVSAHRLHICPNRGLFCARLAQPAFLCIKRREVRRTRLSSTLCVPLHPSAGWLQGSPYRRFLLPPAFRFAGAAVLPGSGLGNRNLPRSSLPVPAGACRNSTCSPGCWCRCAIPGNPSCCCTDGNFSKKREGWTVPALLTKKIMGWQPWFS